MKRTIEDDSEMMIDDTDLEHLQFSMILHALQRSLFSYLPNLNTPKTLISRHVHANVGHEQLLSTQGEEAFNIF